MVCLVDEESQCTESGRENGSYALVLHYFPYQNLLSIHSIFLGTFFTHQTTRNNKRRRSLELPYHFPLNATTFLCLRQPNKDHNFKVTNVLYIGTAMPILLMPEKVKQNILQQCTSVKETEVSG